MNDAKRMIEMNSNKTEQDVINEDSKVDKNVKMSEDNRMMNMLVNKMKEMETEFDLTEHLIVDFGNATTKIGLSGEDLPRVTIPSIWADSNIDPEKKNEYNFELKSYLYGYEALDSKLIDSYNIKYLNPGDHKSLIDIEFFDCFLKKILDEKFSQINPADFKVLMNISAIKNSENIIRIGKMLLEDMNFKAFALINSASLSLFSTGRTSGLIVDVGEKRSYVVPIYEGFPLYHALNKNRIGGRDLTKVFSDGLTQNSIGINKNDLQNLRMIKEKTSSVPFLKEFEYYMNKDEDIITPEKKLYKLPDNTDIITVPKSVRLLASELLFTPSILGKTDIGIVNLVSDSIKKTVVDNEELKNLMINNIVLSGGTTMMSGFPQRLKKTLSQNLATELPNYNSQVCAEGNRSISTWIGASMIASMSSFDKVFIKKDEFNENGEDRLPLFSKIF